jgi:tRNA (adenine37-N6)-methyltransferase
MFSTQPIGYVRSPYKDTQEIPKGIGAKHEAEGVLEIQAEFAPGLTDIEGFSHLIVIWEFDRSEGFDLVGKPPTSDADRKISASIPSLLGCRWVYTSTHESLEALQI